MAIILVGNCPRWELSGGQLSGGSSPGGSCPGGLGDLEPLKPYHGDPPPGWSEPESSELDEDSDAKELLTDEAKKYKKLIRSKMRKFRKDLNEKIRVLHSNDTKRYWEVLNQCNKARDNPPPPQKKKYSYLRLQIILRNLAV